MARWFEELRNDKCTNQQFGEVKEPGKSKNFAKLSVIDLSQIVKKLSLVCQTSPEADTGKSEDTPSAYDVADVPVGYPVYKQHQKQKE